ncbi:MAG: T9SS type A sorting domain-containing protein [Bacteroidales bacterium]|nr:T9SS type A sorting domain-containing protein [Bacteroidales bacterium]MBN2818891.1 T9SS type A sorting domain-containing protein [Bacteroidales bacterium]
MIIKKTLGIVLISFSSLSFLVAQPTLTKQNHSLMAGEDNPMTLCEYTSPGINGADVVWDFSGLVVTKTFTGHVNMTNGGAEFPRATTALEEFGANFYFEENDNELIQLGYISENKKTVITYNQPFVKMQYPFNFGDNIHGVFGGDYFYNNKEIGQIDGTSSVEADAWGTLLLPNAKEYPNTLRVKTVKNYTLKFTSSSQDVEIATYRWYNSIHRYPLLVLTEITTTTGNNKSVKFQAAYNNNAVSAIDDILAVNSESISLYPNPSEGELYLTFSAEQASQVQLTIFDVVGKQLHNNTSVNLVQGMNTISLTDVVDGFKPGTYILKLYNNGTSLIQKEFIITE